MAKCPQCSREGSEYSIRSHIWKVHTEAGMAHKPGRGGGRPAWNKGKTTPPEVREKIRVALTGKPGKIPSLESRKCLSEKILSKVANGTWHISFSKARRYDYKGVQLHGLWEVAYAEYLDKHNTKWSRPVEMFPYEFEGKKRNYTPDFYLPETDEYIEIKGYPTPKDRAKWAAFSKKLRIVFGKELFELGLITSYKNIVE